MVARHLHNTTTPDSYVQAQILYHWLTFVNQFTVVETNGPSWTALTYSGSAGVINNTTPQAFYEANPVFTGALVGKHIAIRDAANPTNCFIGQITSLVSPTRINLDSSASLTFNSTNVEYIVFDTASPPIATNFFVLQTPSTSGPAWQVRCVANGSPNALSFELGFTGGWDVGTNAWLLPVSASHWLPSSVSRLFCIADSTQGYFYLWSESPPGGVAASRSALWVGALNPFHSPAELGAPKDLSYSAIFGSVTSPGPANNLNRDTTVADSFVIGEALNDVGSVVPVYIAQKRLLSSSVDTLALAAAATNPRSMQTDDYDAVCFMRSGFQGWRGRVPGVRILNDVISNRTPLNGNFSYVLGNGIGAIWNGKAPQP